MLSPELRSVKNQMLTCRDKSAGEKLAVKLGQRVELGMRQVWLA
jgi:hypothetical protein